ncbi:hypothetical protein MTO98_19820 [Mucilaginibacter sp. SMC90]|uniref:hypothetical protein n=1 Tax=Mucilaginibacter sp. SMC90 TaxID=2929803 RepID=UPI001FB35311|nr:hypothetical protein [Mucilaginibacter sp. SMC90]UOE46655.1 hypothetical protein MTO98_19820 [Mucilaginibacter sp. SMC90]
MDLFEAVFDLYEQIRLKAENDFQDLIKCQYTQQCYSDNGAFCLVLEITVLKNISDDDYGLIFAINAQTEPNHPGLGSDAKGIFLIADVHHGDNKPVSSLNELVFDPQDDGAIQDAYAKIEQFIRPFIASASDLLVQGYDIKVQDNSVN